MKPFRYFGTTTVFFLAFCSQKLHNQNPVGTSSRFIYAGLYVATIPSASCDGLYSILRLNEDNTYQLRIKKLGISDTFTLEKGTFTWDVARRLLRLSGPGPESNVLKFDKGNFILLDKSGKIQGDDEAERASFEFRPADNVVKEIRWLLTEVNGRPLPQGEPYLQPPFIYFPLRDNSLQGFGGCNNFSGPVTLREEGSINVAHIAATKKLCTDVTIEKDYLQNLQEANRFKADESELVLMKDNQPILRFKAQY
jgi:heat shock protein HslJ